jgi:hypothetical protein
MKRLVFAVALMLIGSCTFAQTQSSAPSAEFLSAALVDQLLRASGSVVVDYTYDPGPNAEDRTPMSFHYVRTADALRLEQVGPGPVERIVDSLDRASKEFRQLHVDRAGGSRGSITNKVTGLFGIQATVDPIYRWVGASPLFEAIRRGTVSADQESIDGHPCWRVEIPADPKVEDERPYKRYLVWLDPTIHFNPRKIEWDIRGDLPKLPSSEVRFLDYEDLGDGLWFPKRVEFVLTWHWGKVRPSSAEIKSVEAGKSIASGDVLVKFSKNTEVTDVIQQMQYTVP